MESREIFNGLLETLSMLPIGGKLVGIVLDGVRVEKELKLSRKVWEDHEDLVREEMDEGDSFKDLIRMYDIGRSHFKLSRIILQKRQRKKIQMQPFPQTRRSI